jgi:aminopeptidase-like protein
VKLFQRISEELPIELRRYASGMIFNGWLAPYSWRVEKAEVRKNGRIVFDGRSNVLGVGAYSKSFKGTMDLAELQKHVVTNSQLPDAYIFHSMWQYRPWNADWALSIPYEVWKDFEPGQYEVELITHYEKGEMLVAEYHKKGRSDVTFIFNAHTCHPCMANDDFAGVAVLIRLFQWLQGQDTYYSYRLVLGPEHLGTIFYLHDIKRDELDRIVGGAFAEMPGTQGPVKLASSFLGNQMIDRALRHAARHYSKAYVFMPWRQGAGNDETVWEAPGYEIPFVEVSRSEDLLFPYREYHTSLDTVELMDENQLNEFFNVFCQAVQILETNCVIRRKFDGLICLSNPEYDLYFERRDPAVEKNLEADSEKWGYLLDCLLRYFDGSMSILDIAEKHDLSFDRVYSYLKKFQQKELVEMEFTPVQRTPVSSRK